jgi:hypothetical protein
MSEQSSKVAIASVVSLPRNAVTMRTARTKYAGSWDVGRESGIPVRMSTRPSRFQQWIAKVVLWFIWLDAE